MSGVSILEAIVITWSFVRVVFLGLAMYHSILEMHEDDRIFIGREGVILEREQRDILRRIGQLNPWIKGWAGLREPCFY
jgi:hypothetical protein